MQSFELENNRLIKNLLQLLGANEEALAREIGASKDELHSWKRGTEIPAKYKRKMQHLMRIAEFGKSFMSLMEKMGQDLEDGVFPGHNEPDILSEGEAALAQAINAALDGYLEDQPFTLWEAHNHFTVAALHAQFDHHIFSAYATRQNTDTFVLFPEFLSAFIDHSNILTDWVCKKNKVDSLDELPCEIAHNIISIIINLTCSRLIEDGYDSDYDGFDVSSYLQQKTEDDISNLIEMVKMIDGRIDVNYYRLMDPAEDILDENMYLDEEDEFEESNSYKIQKHLSLEAKSILTAQKEILEQLELSNALAELRLPLDAILPALFNATCELARLKKAIKESGNTSLKVNEKTLRTCTTIIREHGFEI